MSCFTSTVIFPIDFSKADAACRRNFGSSSSGKLVYDNSTLTRIRGTTPTRRALITSVLGRKAQREVVIPDPDYRIPIVLFGMAGGFVYADNIVAAVPVGLLGLLLLVQATRVRFVFDKDSLEVKVGEELKESGENVFVGGKNRWKMGNNSMMLWWKDVVLQKLADPSKCYMAICGRTIPKEWFHWKQLRKCTITFSHRNNSFVTCVLKWVATCTCVTM